MRLLSLIAIFLFTLSSSQATSFINNPETFYQRGREKEYLKHLNFYQWWYFNLRDVSTGTYFALDYSYLKSSINTSGSYVLFSQFNNIQNMQVYEKWPLNDFKIKNFCDVSITEEFSMKVLDDNTIHLTGHMSYLHNKTWAYEHIDPKSYDIQWDFRIKRIHGWFGQVLEESVLANQGVIGWNTYGHSSQLADDNGWIRINDMNIKLKINDYQVYADMNYGSTFPSSSSLIPVKEDINYPWTWMHVYHQTKEVTVSIVAGIGRQELSKTAFCGTSDGAYINVWISRPTSNISLGYSQILSCNKSITLIKQSTDGNNFTIEQKLSNWKHRTDSFGTHLIPLEHMLRIQSPNYLIKITCYAKIDNYLRFLFPLSDFIFSDFEAIGVPCHVIIKDDDTIDFWTFSSGIEFGYRAII